MGSGNKAAVVGAAFLLAATTVVATEAPAVAADPCSAGKLCLWEDINFANGVDVTSRTTVANCIGLGLWGDGFQKGIGSYYNNLPVKVDVYSYDPFTWYYIYNGTIRAGGFSSNSLSGHFGDNAGAVCTGGANPWTHPPYA